MERREDSSFAAHTVDTNTTKATTTEKTGEEETSFKEFLEAVQPRSQAKFWSNDDAINPNATRDVEQKRKLVKESNGSDASSSTDDENESESEDEDTSENIKSKRTVVAGKSDLDFLKSKVSKTLDNENDDDEDNENQVDEVTDTSPHGAPTSDKKVEEYTDVTTTRLFIKNLPYSTGEDDLREYFEGYGEMEEVGKKIIII